MQWALAYVGGSSSLTYLCCVARADASLALNIQPLQQVFNIAVCGMAHGKALSVLQSFSAQCSGHKSSLWHCHLIELTS